MSKYYPGPRAVTISILFSALLSFALAIGGAYFEHYEDHDERDSQFFVTDTQQGGWRVKTALMTTYTIHRGYLPPVTCWWGGKRHTPEELVASYPDYYSFRTRDSIPRWVRWPGSMPSSQSYTTTQAYGFPFPFMHRAYAGRSGHGNNHQNARTIDLSSIGLRQDFCCPTGVAMPGLLGNILVYTGCFCFIAIPKHHLIRTFRARRGRCPNCKYDLVHNLNAGCPECGWNRNLPE